MALYLVQHGKSRSSTEDPEKKLSAEGKADSERIGEVSAGYRVPVAQILHSGKMRAQQTAEIFKRHLSPPSGMDMRTGMNPLDDVCHFARAIDIDRNLMLVGHLPFLERLIGLLVCGNPDQLVFKMQNSGIVCLDRIDGTSHPVICWALMPTIA
jgi:phosphohistidine phosphatase